MESYEEGKRKYKFYVVNVQTISIDSGWEFREDALERAVSMVKDEKLSPGAVKVMTKPRVGNVVLDPNDSSSWVPKRNNPASDPKTRERDERLWKEAKEAAREMGREGDYAYVMGVFKRMRKDGTKKNPRRHPGDDPYFGGAAAEITDDDVEEALLPLRHPVLGHIQTPRGDQSHGRVLRERDVARKHLLSRTTPRENPNTYDELPDQGRRVRARPGTKEHHGTVVLASEGELTLLDGDDDSTEVVVEGHGHGVDWEYQGLRNNPGELLVVNPEVDSAKAERVYEMWHKKQPHNINVLRAGCDEDDVMVCVGRAHNIVYRSGKWEKGRKTNDYVHHFDSKPKVYMLAKKVGDGSGEKTVGQLLRGARNADGKFAVADLATPLSFGLDDKTDDGEDIAIHSGARVYGAIDQRTVLILDPKWGLIVVKGGKMYFDERGIVK